MHVALDLELALHEGVLGVEFAGEEVGGIVVEHGEGSVGLAFLAVLDGSVSVLEVDGPEGSGFALGRSDLHVVDVSNFLHGFCSLAGEEGFDLIEDDSNLHYLTLSTNLQMTS